MVPIMTLRRTKRTVGVNQLFIEAQIEEGLDTDSSYILCVCVLWWEKVRKCVFCRGEREKWESVVDVITYSGGVKRRAMGGG